MRRKILLVLALLSWLVLVLVAAILLVADAPAQSPARFKTQVFGAAVKPLDQPKTTVMNGGIALRINFDRHHFARFQIAGGVIKTPTAATPLVLTSAQYGLQATKRVALVGGVGLVKTKTPILTGFFGVNVGLSPHWSVFVPVAVNRNGPAVGFGVAYTF